MAVSQYKSVDALAFVKHKRAMMEAIQASSLGLGELPTLISAIALGTQKQFQKFLSERSQLEWAFCELHDQDVMEIAESLKVNATVTYVFLRGNQISDQGAMAIAEALNVNTTVTHVDLARNQISDQGAMAIAEALNVNATVTYVGLGGNRISYQLRIDSEILPDRIRL